MFFEVFAQFCLLNKKSIFMAYLGPILMGNEAKVLNCSASGGASNGAPSPAGGGGFGARTASFRTFARKFRCARRLAAFADIFSIYLR